MDFCIVDEDMLDMEKDNGQEDVLEPFLTFVSFSNFKDNFGFKLCSTENDDSLALKQDGQDTKLR